MSYCNFEEIGNGKNYVLLRLILSGSSSCTESLITFWSFGSYNKYVAKKKFSFNLYRS